MRNVKTISKITLESEWENGKISLEGIAYV